MPIEDNAGSGGHFVDQASATAIVGPYPPTAPSAYELDGSTDYLRLTTDFTGNADSKTGIFSMWVRIDIADVTWNFLTDDASLFVQFRRRSVDNQIQFLLKNSSGTVIAQFESSAISVSTDYAHVLASWSLGITTTNLYINDVSDKTDLVGPTNDTIDYTRSEWAIGADTAGSGKWDGAISEMYFAPGQYLDFSVIANRRKFIDANGNPVRLGSNGRLPTGTQPILYMFYDQVRMSTDLLADVKKRPSKTISLFELDLASTTRGYSEAWAAASNRLYEGLVINSGRITRGVSDSNFNLPSDSARFQIYDKDRDLEKVLMGNAVGSVSGSAARIKIASRTLAQTSWFTVFKGIISSFSSSRPRAWDITLKRDDRPLQGLANIPHIQSYDWPQAPAASLGAPAQLVYGKHDSTGTGFTGLVPTVHVSTVNHSYVVSFGIVASIDKVYVDGVEESTANWSTAIGTFINGKYWSGITFTSDQGTKTVTVDCEGLTDSGVIQNPATILEHFLTNFVFWRLGKYYNTAKLRIAICFSLKKFSA